LRRQADRRRRTFAQFKLWFDNNGSGTTGAGELLSLTDLGVAAIRWARRPARPRSAATASTTAPA